MQANIQPYQEPDPLWPNSHVLNTMFLLVYRMQCMAIASVVELHMHDTLAFVIIMLLCWVNPEEAVQIIKAYLHLDT